MWKMICPPRRKSRSLCLSQNQKQYLCTHFLPTKKSGYENNSFCYLVDDQCYRAVKVQVSDYKYEADLVVYKTTYKYEADGNKGVWYFTDYKYDAKKKIYFTDYKYEADLVIYFTTYKYEAGWQKKEKQHLMY